MIEERQASVDAFQFLRQFARRRQPVERCEMCGTAVAAEHQHLLEPVHRRIACACDACAILFQTQGAIKYKRVPRVIRFLPDFQLTDSQWNGLMMPINMAFFFKSIPHDRRVIAMYPSPAGATESLLTLDTWDDIAANNPVLEEMEADVEALLVNRIGHSRGFTQPEHYLVPIDECYRDAGVFSEAAWSHARTTSRFRGGPMNEWEWQLLEDKPSLGLVRVRGVEIKLNDRVRLHPKQGADLMDLALAGKVAVVESIEQDYEGRFKSRSCSRTIRAETRDSFVSRDIDFSFISRRLSPHESSSNPDRVRREYLPGRRWIRCGSSPTARLSTLAA